MQFFWLCTGSNFSEIFYVRWTFSRATLWVWKRQTTISIFFEMPCGWWWFTTDLLSGGAAEAFKVSRGHSRRLVSLGKPIPLAMASSGTPGEFESNIEKQKLLFLLQVSDKQLFFPLTDRHVSRFTHSIQDSVLEIAEHDQVNETWFPPALRVLSNHSGNPLKVWTIWTFPGVQKLRVNFHVVFPSNSDTLEEWE